MNALPPMLRRRLPLLLMLAGALLRIEYLREFSESPLFGFALGADVLEYDRRAREILNGVWFSPVPDIHAPLYGWTLAMLYRLGGMSVPWVRIAQTLINFFAWIGFFHYWKRRGKPDDPTPEIFLALAMLYPAAFFFQAEPISESLLIPLLLAAVALFDHADRAPTRRAGRCAAAGGGLVLGLAAITHPLTLPFLALEWIAQMFDGAEGRRRALLLIAAALLPILPVSIHRSRIAGRPVLIQSNSAFNLWLGNSPDADGGCWLRPGADWRAVHAEAEAEAQAEGTTADRVFLNRTLRFLGGDPLGAAVQFGRKALLVWSPVELAAGADTPGILYYTPLLRRTATAMTTALLILALAGFWPVLRDPRRRWEYRHPLLLAAALFLAQVLTVTSGRYRLAMLPALMLIAAAGLTAPGFRLRTRLGLLVGAAAVITAAGLAVPARPLESAEAASLYGEALYRQGRLDAAAALLQPALDAGIDPARDANLLGEIRRRQGRAEEARRWFALAAEAAPDEVSGVMNLGILALERGDRQEALARFAEAVRRDPRHADAAYNYALALEPDDPAAAETGYRRALAADPGHRRSLNALGVLAFRRGDFAAAADWFARALRLEPDNAGLRRNLTAAEAARRRAEGGR